MNYKQKCDFIDEHFDIIFGGVLSQGEKIYLGQKESRKCRFCECSYPIVKFTEDAHAVPESIGNRRLILYEECDDCNTFFSNELEDSFDKFTKPFRSMSGVKGKKGAPSYKTKEKTARLDINLANNEIHISGDESKIFMPDENNQNHTFKIHRDSYKPLAVYKALVKMTLSILPNEDLSLLRETIKWVRFNQNSDNFPGPHIINQRIAFGASFGGGLFVMVWRRKPNIDSKIPFVMILVSMGTLVIQASIPQKDETTKDITSFIFPIPEEDSNHIKSDMNDLSSNDWVRNETLTFGFSSDPPTNL